MRTRHRDEVGMEAFDANDTSPAAGRSARSIHEVVEVVGDLTRFGRILCPADADPQEWARQVLGELARTVESLDRAVAHVSGRHNDAVGRYAHGLAAAIDAHANITLAPHTHSEVGGGSTT